MRQIRSGGKGPPGRATQNWFFKMVCSGWGGAPGGARLGSGVCECGGGGVGGAAGGGVVLVWYGGRVGGAAWVATRGPAISCRNFTSRLEGCTFTSTSRGSISTNKQQTGNRPFISAV